MKTFGERVSTICINSKFNGNILIAKGKDILFQNGFGYSDRKNKQPFNNHSIFRIGSITKQFTALCILQLCEQGVLKLNDPITMYIEDVDYKYPVTIHHLLSNSSGIPNFDVFGDYDELLESNNFHERMVKEVILKPSLHFVPGERFEYSSSGFFILTYLIELLSKKPYHQYLQEYVFDRLNMKDTGFHFVDKMIPNFVSLYDMKDGKIVEAARYDMRKASGAGGLYSTTYDLYLWGRGLIENLLISKEQKDLMFSVQTPINQYGGYGYGIISIQYEMNHEFHCDIYHPGNGPGVFAQNKIIDSDIQIILLSNVNDKKSFQECFDKLDTLVKGEMI